MEFSGLIKPCFPIKLQHRRQSWRMFPIKCDNWKAFIIKPNNASDLNFGLWPLLMCVWCHVEIHWYLWLSLHVIIRKSAMLSVHLFIPNWWFDLYLILQFRWCTQKIELPFIGFTAPVQMPSSFSIDCKRCHFSSMFGFTIHPLYEYISQQIEVLWFISCHLCTIMQLSS